MKANRAFNFQILDLAVAVQEFMVDTVWHRTTPFVIKHVRVTRAHFVAVIRIIIEYSAFTIRIQVKRDFFFCTRFVFFEFTEKEIKLEFNF
jgi:hypothetical protein